MKTKILLFVLTCCLMLCTGCKSGDDINSAEQQPVSRQHENVKEFSEPSDDSKAEAHEKQVNLIISRDFGHEILLDIQCAFTEAQSVMELLNNNTQVETAYGGGFVNSINGLKSGYSNSKNKKKLDWFYYVNGIMPDLGANEYILGDGDTVIWDYHDWSVSRYVKSIIGAYPSNFTKGFDGQTVDTHIYCDKQFEESAVEMEKYLKREGAKGLQIKTLGDEKEISDDGVNSIVIGMWDDIRGISYISDVYKNSKKTGLFFKIDDAVKALNHKAEKVKQYEEAAVVASVLKSPGSPGCLWIITGNDSDCINRAVSLFYSEFEQLKGRFSVIVTENEVCSIPIGG